MLPPVTHKPSLWGVTWVTPFPFCQAYPSTHTQSKADLYPVD